MNNKIEACRQCPVQCKLEERSEQIILESKDDPDISNDEIRNRISVMSQLGGRLNCPSSEIARLRKKTAVAIDPDIQNPTYFGRTYDAREGEQYPHYQEPRRTWTQYTWKKSTHRD